MKSQNTPEASSIVTDLQRKWQQPNHLDCAGAIHKAHQEGASFCGLAKVLNCSPSLLRQLNLAAQAPPPDLLLARQGSISIRELARRSKTAKAPSLMRRE